MPGMLVRMASLCEMVDHTLGRVLDLFEIDIGLVRRWTGDKVRPKDDVSSAN